MVFSNYVFRKYGNVSSKGLRSWYCVMHLASHGAQCKAVLLTDALDHIVQIRGVHTHKAPHITSTPEGIIYEHREKKHKGKSSVKNVINKIETAMSKETANNEVKTEKESVEKQK